ncbi:MAG: hypothetical protein P9M01_03290 [Candidatus Kappaea frigidicola]|nr:hypothetical protein [Candidatus Kappaea frigidicola]
MKSNPLLSNIEKIIFGVLIVISLVVIVIYQGGIYIKDKTIKNQMAKLKFNSPPKEIEGVEGYENLLVQLKQADNFSNYESNMSRNGFLKFIEPPPKIPPFELKAVRKIYLDVEYRGFIQSSSGTVGQLKVSGRSHFVKKGDEVDGYAVERVCNEYILIKDTDGVEYRLPLGEKILSDNYEAALYVTKTHKTVKVKLGDMLNDFKVLDISPNSVVLFNQNYNQKLIVEK